MPCFEGLFQDPDNDGAIQDVLFMTALWHAYGKSHLHSDSSLGIYDGMTVDFCGDLRYFKNDVCPAYRTRPTPQEEKRQASGGGQFSLKTSKIHSIPDYPNMIRMFGTTDNYSTQNVRAFSYQHSTDFV